MSLNNTIYNKTKLKTVSSSFATKKSYTETVQSKSHRLFALTGEGLWQFQDTIQKTVD